MYGRSTHANEETPLSLKTNYFSTSDLTKGTYIISIELSDGRFTENRLVVE